jgi:hypothetical protein
MGDRDRNQQIGALVTAAAAIEREHAKGAWRPCFAMRENISLCAPRKWIR